MSDDDPTFSKPQITLARLREMQPPPGYGVASVKGVDTGDVEVLDDAGAVMAPADVFRALRRLGNKPPGRPKLTREAFQAKEAEARSRLGPQATVKAVASAMGYDDVDSYRRRRRLLGL